MLVCIRRQYGLFSDRWWYFVGNGLAGLRPPYTVTVTLWICTGRWFRVQKDGVVEWVQVNHGVAQGCAEQEDLNDVRRLRDSDSAEDEDLAQPEGKGKAT